MDKDSSAAERRDSAAAGNATDGSSGKHSTNNFVHTGAIGHNYDDARLRHARLAHWMITRRQIAELKALAIEEGDRRREAALEEEMAEKDTAPAAHPLAYVECCMHCHPEKAFDFLRSVFVQKGGGQAVCQGCGYIVSLVRNEDERFKGLDFEPGGYTILCEEPWRS